MIVRIVKMTFEEDKLDDFLSLFNTVSNQIAAFPGCLSLHIYSDVADKHVIFTYSEWKSEEDLNHYRNSPLFRNTWAQTKKLFKAAPVAWSMRSIQ